MTKKIADMSNYGILMILIGAMILFPLIVLPWYPTECGYAWSFLVPGGFSILLGLLVCKFGKRESSYHGNWRMDVGRSSFIVLFAWGWGVLLGAMPLYLGQHLTLVQSLFEAVSGWTTTGLSVMNVAETPQIYLFHRSFMQYCGGLGFIMMMIMFISNKHAMNLYSAEGHPDRIMPNIKKTAQAIFYIYNICLVLGAGAYRIAGMNWFDGFCHSMCSLSTGGFSTKLNSIGEYNSFSIEFITIVLMLIGTTNFAALILLAKGKVKSFFKVSEVRFMFLVLLVFIPVTAVSLSNGLHISFLKGLRKSAFDVISALSTTGYSTMSYASWPPFAIGVLILMMIIGGGIGSTAGGMKLSRVYILLRTAKKNFMKKIRASRYVEREFYVKAAGKVPLDQETEEEASTYLISYLLIYIVGSLLITVTANCSLTEAMFDFASSLGTVGLSIGITNPMTNAPTLIIEMIGMLMGRLEIFIIFVGIVFGFNAVRKNVHKHMKRA